MKLPEYVSRKSALVHALPICSSERGAPAFYNGEALGGVDVEMDANVEKTRNDQD